MVDNVCHDVSKTGLSNFVNELIKLFVSPSKWHENVHYKHASMLQWTYQWKIKDLHLSATTPHLWIGFESLPSLSDTFRANIHTFFLHVPILIPHVSDMNTLVPIVCNLLPTWPIETKSTLSANRLNTKIELNGLGGVALDSPISTQKSGLGPVSAT